MGEAIINTPSKSVLYTFSPYIGPSANRGLLTTVALNDQYKAMIVGRLLLV